MSRIQSGLILAALLPLTGASAVGVTYPGGEGPGQGKHIVLVAGDEEYRSEEALPCLGKILSTHHGFRCTVLFSMTDDWIDPNNQRNIPGLEALADADLMIIATRFRDLPDEQMRHIDAYLKRGGPVVGLRTATHAFNIKEGTYAHYSWKYNGPEEGWKKGFGRQVLGETWVAHHGHHKKEATRGVIAEGAEDHPVARGCGDIFGPTDVYRVNLPLPGDSFPIVLGAVLTGMNPDDPILEGPKNAPMMPVAWTKTYEIPGGKTGRCFTTTMGASTDLLSEGCRRMIVNGTYWALGMEDRIPEAGTRVDLVGEFSPTMYGFKRGTHWPDKNLKPEDFNR